MSIRCLLGFHDVGAPVKRDGKAHWKCMRCHGLSPLPIDLPVLPDRPVAPAKPDHASPIWWLRAVYERKSS